MSKKPLFSDLGSRNEIVSFLKKKGFPQERITHSCEVADLGLKISDLMIDDGVMINRAVVDNGALLHDIGYLQVHGRPVKIPGWEGSGIIVPEDDINHPILGAIMAKEWGFNEPVADCVLRHNIGGFTIEECMTLKVEPTPQKDCTPTTFEEKIVRYADHLMLLKRLSMDPFQDPQVSARACLPWLNYYFTSRAGTQLDINGPLVQREVTLSNELAKYGKTALSHSSQSDEALRRK